MPVSSRVPEQVLDLFAVPDDVQELTGGQGGSVVAGDLVLSPGRDPGLQAWLSPVLARLAVGIDERASRTPRDLRIAVPVPARDGSWVVDGWAASRHESGTRTCEDLDVLLAAGRVLHAELAVAVPTPPAWLGARGDRWAVAERLAFGPPADAVAAARDRAVTGLPDLVAQLLAITGPDLGPDQLVHADLAGNVLIDGYGAPVVIDVAPAWRPVLWAEAVCVVDAVGWFGADPSEVTGWSTPAERAALARAVVFRLLSDDGPEPAAYRGVLGPLLA